MKTKLLFFSLLMLALGGSLRAQDFIQNYSFVKTGPQGPGTSFANTGVTSFFMSWSPQTSMNTCSVQADSSSDGSSWGNGDLIASQSCTTAGSATTATLGNGKNFVRVNVTVMSGTGGLNVTLKGWGGAGVVGGSSFPLTTAAAINSGGSITVNTGGSITPAGSGAITATSMPASGLTGTPCTSAQGCTGVASPTVHAILVGEGASPVTPVACNVTGQTLVGTNGADPSCKSAGLSGTDVNSASYTVQCDSATATIDRTTTLRFITTTPTVTVPDPTASGCGSNFSFVMVASGVTATVNRTTTAVFNIYGRSGDPTLAATTFNLTTGQYATISSPDNTNWLVRIVPAAAAGAGVGTLYSVGAAQSTIATASPQFFPINGANSGGAGEGNVASVIGGTGCTAKNAYVVTSNTNGAAALTITLRNAATLAGMANTAIVITVGSGAAAGTFNDTTHTVSISAGTVLSWNATMGGAGLTSAQIVGIGFQCN